jgi:cation diffusion facilitator CzcD-associated flavoprotein CzcO
VSQGFTTRKKVWYAKDVLHMLDEYVRVQSLEPYIRLNTDVVAHEWSDEQDRWILTVSTAGGHAHTGAHRPS